MKGTLLDMLREEGHLDQKSYDKIVELNRQTREDVSYLLLQQNLFQEESLLRLMEEYYEIPYILLDRYLIDDEAIRLVPEKTARDLKIIPLFIQGGRLTVAIEDPLNLDILNYLRALTGMEISFFISTRRQILKKINDAYASQEGVREVMDRIGRKAAQTLEADSYLKELTVRDDDEAPAVELVSFILQKAVQSGASDIHLEPLEDRVALRYRIDGILHPMPAPPQKMLKAIISRVKILAGLDVAERRLPQDGRLSQTIQGDKYDFRVSIIPFIHGEGAVIRVLNLGATSTELDSIGFEEEDLARFKKLVKSPFGLLLVTGPTGSGKSTTLYSALQFLNSPEKKIVTIEDPVEYRIDQVMQIQVRPEIDFNFAEGLRSILRHDPDIVMLGEIRDLESAEITARLALTGHFVLSTLHTNDAASAIDRLVDLGLPPYLVNATVTGIVAQRLLRKICPHCREPFVPDLALRKLLVVRDRIVRDGGTFYRAKGCDACSNIGYKGRLAVYELLALTEEMRNLSSREFNARSIRALARRRGVLSLRSMGILKAAKGLTSLDEVFSITAGEE